MISRKATIICRAVFTATTALLLMFIFGNSAAEGEDSGQLSLMVTQWLNAVLERLGIPLELSHQFVRKLAHFTEYSLLGASLTFAIWSWCGQVWSYLRIWLPVLCGAGIAGLDEWLQTFVPDRHGCISDVLLDTAGVLWAVLAASAVIHYICRRANKDNTQKNRHAAE